jgi:hypothetical protein
VGRGLVAFAIYAAVVYGLAYGHGPIRTLCAVIFIACALTIIGWWLYGCARFGYPPRHDGIFYE